MLLKSVYVLDVRHLYILDSGVVRVSNREDLVEAQPSCRDGGLTQFTTVSDHSIRILSSVRAW